jgi:hypothetical protein
MYPIGSFEIFKAIIAPNTSREEELSDLMFNQFKLICTILYHPDKHKSIHELITKDIVELDEKLTGKNIVILSVLEVNNSIAKHFNERSKNQNSTYRQFVENTLGGTLVRPDYSFKIHKSSLEDFSKFLGIKEEQFPTVLVFSKDKENKNYYGIPITDMNIRNILIELSEISDNPRFNPKKVEEYLKEKFKPLYPYDATYLHTQLNGSYMYMRIVNNKNIDPYFLQNTIQEMEKYISIISSTIKDNYEKDNNEYLALFNLIEQINNLKYASMDIQKKTINEFENLHWLDSKSKEYIELFYKYFSIMEEDKNTLDFKGAGIYLANALEYEINATFFQYFRTLVKIEVPKFYKKLVPDKNMYYYDSNGHMIPFNKEIPHNTKELFNLELGTLWFIYLGITSKSDNLVSKFFKTDQIKSIRDHWEKAKDIRNKIAHTRSVSKEEILDLKNHILSIWSGENGESFEKLKKHISDVS